ncbi:hypothetical protein P4S52_20535 [Vibrio sp. SA48]|uniref:Uncharacterized protein n=1 Tax=Vibrio ouci TaxID=2499078 RepID=A0A4Y8W979_9VIBR|nr:MULTISPECIES: hypothetical protein [Vibrio]EKO3854981.1 hypothetical protein [Vibrio harveyi]TFH89196.1 hypothetical protein ELS82_23535 [Vibrio ouci]
MKKVISVLFGLALLAGCENNQEPITLSAEKGDVTYLLSVNATNASITIGKNTETLTVKAYDSNEILLEDKDGNALNFKQQPSLSNWLCDLCVNHGLPVTWK